MNVELLERKQLQVIEKYGVDPKIVGMVKEQAERMGHYIIGYLVDQEAFIFSDGEPYTIDAFKRT